MQRLSSLFDRLARPRTVRVAATVATVVASTVASTVARAQQHQTHQDQQPTSPLRISPEVIVIDPATQTARLRLINTTKTWANADFTLQNAAPQPTGAKPAAADSAKTDSLARTRSLQTWITKLPPQVMLSPHETLTVTLQFTIPKTLSPGEYSAYVVAHSGDRPTGLDGVGGLGLILGGIISDSTAKSQSSSTTTVVVMGGTPDTAKQSGDSTSGPSRTGTSAAMQISIVTTDTPTEGSKNGGQAAESAATDTRPFAAAKLVYRAEKK